MSNKILSLILVITLSLTSCSNEEEFDPTDLAAAIQGEFIGTLNSNGATPIENYSVTLTKLTNNSVVLNSNDCNDITIFLDGNTTGAIFGQADALTNFNYLVGGEELQFLFNSPFKTFEGVKE